MGEGPVTLDASKSSDPDAEDDGSSSLGFAWSCTPPAGSPGAASPGGAAQAGSAAAACLDVAGAALAALPSGPAISLQLRGSPQGENYTLTVTVSKPDGRSAAMSVFLVVRSAVRIPAIALQALSAPKVSPSAKLVLAATVTSASSSALTTGWSVVSPPQLAGTAWLASAAGTPLSSQSLVINAGKLPPRQTVLFRITATDAGGTATADVAVPVSGAPYGPGGPGTTGNISISQSVGCDALRLLPSPPPMLPSPLDAARPSSGRSPP